MLPRRVVPVLSACAFVSACGADGLKNVSNKPPIAVAGEDRDAVAGQELSFDGSASHDPDGQVAAFKWDFGDGQTATGALAKHAFAQAGSVTVKLTVTDDEGGTGTDELLVRVAAANKPPVPVIDGPSRVYTKADAAFDGSGSTDEDGHVVQWAWTFGDGQTATGAQATHLYQAAGDYTVTLTVTDDGGLSATSAGWSVQVKDAPPPPPPIPNRSTWTWTGQDSGSFLCASGFGRLTIDIANPSSTTTSGITVTEASPGGAYTGQLDMQTRAFDVTHTMSGLSSGTESISATFSADWKHFSGTYTLNASGCNKTIPVNGTRQ